MKVIEINPPERALYEGPSDPVIFLTHQGGNSDGWHNEAVETIIDLARTSVEHKLFVANEGRSFFEATSSELERWEARYCEKALRNGAAIVWLASTEFKPRDRRMSTKIEHYLNLLARPRTTHTFWSKSQ